MNSKVIEAFKHLALENNELKDYVVKITSRYKTSEEKRNVLITDNKNLHQQLLGSEKKRILSERAVENYVEALKKLREELKQLKFLIQEEKLSGGDQTLIKSQSDKSVSCSDLTPEPLIQEDESDPYFEVADGSATILFKEKDCIEKQKVKKLVKTARSTGTRTSDESSLEPDLFYPTVETPIENIIPGSEVKVYFQNINKDAWVQKGKAVDEPVVIKPDKKPTIIITPTPKTSAPNVECGKNSENELYEEQQKRLWVRILELREVSRAKEMELETRRFAVAAKTQLIQSAQKEIKRIQNLIALAKT